MNSRPKARGVLTIAALTLAFTLSQASCGGGYGASAYTRADTNAPAEWSAIAVKAVLDASAATPAGVSPMEESRAYAMAFTAAHDALNAIDRSYKPYLSDLRAPDASADAAMDGNPDTTSDAAWTSLEPAPTIPDHASGHAAAAGAGAAVPEQVFVSQGLKQGRQVGNWVVQHVAGPA